MTDNRIHRSESVAEESETHRTRHDWDGPNSLHGEIIDAVAAITGEDLGAVAAKYDVGQSRTIERLFGNEQKNLRSYGLVRFVLNDALVTIHSDGRLITTPTTPSVANLKKRRSGE